jgi:hypothetical protein
VARLRSSPARRLLPAGHFGCATAARHAPDEYFLIEPSDPKLFGFDAAGAPFVDLHGFRLSRQGLLADKRQVGYRLSIT